MTFAEAIRAGFHTINRRMQLVGVQALLMVVNCIGFFVVVGIPLGIAFVIFGLDLTGLTHDPEVPGVLRLARVASDPAVVGIVSGEAGVALGSAGSAADLQTRAPVALTGFAPCRADAGYGAIRVGDLLTASPTPGHAMRSPDAAPGTIVAKALDALDAGTGSIRVLVMLR